MWKNSSPEAYLGTNIENVPNAFLVLGPNVLVYDSFIGLAEAQLDYIVDGLLKIKNKGISKLNVKADVIKSTTTWCKSTYKQLYSIVVAVRVITLTLMVATLQHGRGH